MDSFVNTENTEVTNNVAETVEKKKRGRKPGQKNKPKVYDTVSPTPIPIPTSQPIVQPQYVYVQQPVMAQPVNDKYEPTDTIPCKSCTAGRLGMVGIKSGIVYDWAALGDVTEVEYQDLAAAVRSNASHIFKPYFTISDEKFLNEFPKIRDIYNELYTDNEIKEMLSLPATQLRQILPTLPDGISEALKHVATDMIRMHQIDSISAIKELDAFFGTKLMLLTDLFSE